MERLNEGDWSLLGRYLNREVSVDDLKTVEELFNRHPGLLSTFQKLSINMSIEGKEEFDPTSALRKLHNKLKGEGLL
jgi:hypothetical protein